MRAPLNSNRARLMASVSIFALVGIGIPGSNHEDFQPRKIPLGWTA